MGFKDSKQKSPVALILLKILLMLETSFFAEEDFHPSILFRPLVRGRRGNRSRRETQTPFSPVTLSSYSWGILRRIIPPASPGSAPGPPLSRTCPENLQREATRRHPNQMPEQPQRSSGSTPSSLWMAELLTLSLRLRL